MRAHTGRKESAPRTGRSKIASTTLEAISNGSYTLNNITHNLRHKCESSKEGTLYYGPDSLLSPWSTQDLPSPREKGTEISILEISTLAGARLLTSMIPAAEDPSVQRDVVGILNFASAKNPGGGFLSGAAAQEESIARSSTLYPTLTTEIAQQYYNMHKKDPRKGYYSHSMIYSPQVVVFRDDEGEWVEPLEIDVLTSCAVNAGVVKRGGATEMANVPVVMKERMARILYLFEKQGVKNLVLGSFGTGVFRNEVPMVAANWAELITTPEARFRNSFDRVIFAILGTKTFEDFKRTFEDQRV